VNLYGSWAFIIGIRKSLDFINLRKREFGSLHDYYKEETTIETQESRDAEVRKSLRAIPELTNDQQQVLRLFYTENYALNEISEMLNISVGTVKSKLFHAKEKLKTILKK